VYEFLLRERIATVVATVLLAVLASSLAGAAKLWARGLMYSLAPAMGAAFYAVAFLAEPRPNSADLIAGLLFETSVLALFYRLLLWLKRDMTAIRSEDAIRVLKFGVVLQIILVLPNITSGGFGVWSDGSRIDYLSSSSLAKYFTYSGLLVSTVQAAFLAALVTCRGGLGIIGWTVIATNFALSVLAGSKGGVFLWLMSIASLVDYGRAQIPRYKILLGLVIVTAAVLLSSLVAAEFFGLDLGDFIELATSRFFLNNDARALALDLRTWQSTDQSLFSESFRSLGNLIGFAPRNAPLGVVLYSEGLSITNGNGANTSFMALATYYFPTGYSLLPASLGVVGAILIVLFARLTGELALSATRRVIVTSIWLATFLTYSQDFLAFQVLLPLAVLTVTAIWIYRPKFNATTSSSHHVRR
jgi:hypothetical protein